MSELRYDPTEKSNSSFQVGTKISNFLYLYADLVFFYVYQMLKLGNTKFLLGPLRLSLTATGNLNL